MFLGFWMVLEDVEAVWNPKTLLLKLPGFKIREIQHPPLRSKCFRDRIRAGLVARANVLSHGARTSEKVQTTDVSLTVCTTTPQKRLSQDTECNQ